MAFRKQKNCIECGFLGIVANEKEAARSIFFDKDVIAVPLSVELRSLNSDEIFTARRMSPSKSVDSEETEEIPSSIVTGLKFLVCFKKRNKVYDVSVREDGSNLAMWKQELWENSHCPEFMRRVNGFSPAQQVELEKMGRSRSWSSFGVWVSIIFAIAALVVAALTFLTYYEIVL